MFMKSVRHSGWVSHRRNYKSSLTSHKQSLKRTGALIVEVITLHPEIPREYATDLLELRILDRQMFTRLSK